MTTGSKVRTSTSIANYTNSTKCDQLSFITVFSTSLAGVLVAHVAAGYVINKIIVACMKQSVSAAKHSVGSVLDEGEKYLVSNRKSPSMTRVVR